MVLVLLSEIVSCTYVHEIVGYTYEHEVVSYTYVYERGWSFCCSGRSHGFSLPQKYSEE